MQINDTTIALVAHDPSLRIYNVLVDVVRPVKISSPTGIVESTTVLVSNMSAAIKWKSSEEKILFDKESYFLDAVMSCRVPAGVIILSTDRIVHQGITYEIVAPPTNVNNLGTLLRIALRRVA